MGRSRFVDIVRRRLSCSMRVLVFFLLHFFVGAKASELKNDVELPTINVKFESPLKSYGIGGPVRTASEDVAAFKQRSSNMLHSLEKDAAVAAEFYQTAARNLDVLAGALRGTGVGARH